MKTRLRFIVPIVPFFVITTLIGQSTTATIDEQMSFLFNTVELPGLGLAMVSRDSILYEGSFGFSDIASQTPFLSKTIQNIGSTSKTLIGLALMKLVEQGKIKLDDPINSYLPFKVVHPHFPEKSITVLHLATHTSGIKDSPAIYDLNSYYIDTEYQTEPPSKKGFSLAEKVFLSKTSKNKKQNLGAFLENVLVEDGVLYGKGSFYKHAPGAEYEYTNIGSALAAFIVEEVSNMSYAEFTRKTILKPLRMDSSGWFYNDVDMTRFATRYTGKKHTIVPFYELITYPDGGLKSSVEDMTLYLQEIIRGYFGEGTLLRNESYALLFKNHLNVPSKERSGIFWDIFGSEGPGDIGHSGSDPGIMTFMYFKPETGIGKILFVNTGEYREDVIRIWQAFIEKEQLFIRSPTPKE